MTKPEPIFLAKALSKIDKELIKFLKKLKEEDWNAQTIAPKWKVKDVAVHLLDGNLRTLSMLRDNYYGESTVAINSYDDLINYLNQLNADWVKAMKRLSPKTIIDLLDSSGKEYCNFIESLDPFDKATFSVGWAGENESKNWFHIAREYTEKWHHQQQMRLAVGKDKKLLKEKWFLPYLDTSVRALPHHYRNTVGNKNDLIQFVFKGKNDKEWFLKWQNNTWNLITEATVKPTCIVKIDDKVAWRIFTKGIEKDVALSQSEVSENRILGEPIFNMVAVMA